MPKQGVVAGFAADARASDNEEDVCGFGSDVSSVHSDDEEEAPPLQKQNQLKKKPKLTTATVNVGAKPQARKSASASISKAVSHASSAPLPSSTKKLPPSGRRPSTPKNLSTKVSAISAPAEMIINSSSIVDPGTDAYATRPFTPLPGGASLLGGERDSWMHVAAEAVIISCSYAFQPPKQSIAHQQKSY